MFWIVRTSEPIFARLLCRSHISRRIGENPQVPLGETLMVRENPPGQDIYVMVIELNDAPTANKICLKFWRWALSHV
jgi:hypothetical protein